MNTKKFFSGTLLLINLICFSQNTSRDVLFTVDEKPFYTDEFLRIYKKNINLIKDQSQKDLNQYLDLFVGYKLKTAKAKKLELDKNPNYQYELKSYRNQLAKNYLYDKKVTQELVEEAYIRSLKDIKASHILIFVDENAQPEDTLKAYNQIMDIRKKAIAGEDFGKLAQENSQDTSAKENKGDLGYFSAFRMVYPFETGAYKTKLGEVSMPVRSSFGYHLIKVNDIRDNKGSVKIAHILINKKQENKEENVQAKSKIDAIYKKLQQGENFEALAKQFSEDSMNANSGGILGVFSLGQFNAAGLEEVAFSLTKEKPLSEPYESKFGWQILKLIEKLPVKSLSESQTDLQTKIDRDERSRIITTALIDKIKKEYPPKKDEKLFQRIAQTLTKDFSESKWKKPVDTKPYEGTLIHIKEQKIPGNNFLNYIDFQQKTQKYSKAPINKVANILYEKFQNEMLNNYYDENLENKFPEFSNIMDEYRDGLLLFELMEKEIWEKSKKDTLGLKKFYDDHINDYKWKNRLNADIFSSTKEEVVKKAQKMLKQNKSVDLIKKTLNTDNKIEIIEKIGTFDVDGEELPKNLKPEIGISNIVKQGDYYFVTKINKILPEENKKLEECKGKVINDYQQYLEENWISNLKKEFKVELKNDVFEKLKAQANK